MLYEPFFSPMTDRALVACQVQMDLFLRKPHYIGTAEFHLVHHTHLFALGTPPSIRHMCSKQDVTARARSKWDSRMYLANPNNIWHPLSIGAHCQSAPSGLRRPLQIHPWIHAPVLIFSFPQHGNRFYGESAARRSSMLNPHANEVLS